MVVGERLPPAKFATIAATPVQAHALVKADVHRIFLMSDPSLGAKLRAPVDGLASGEDAEGWLVDDIANLHGSTVIPAEILRYFADIVISVRELEVLWLEYHGLERAQLAARSPSTYSSWSCAPRSSAPARAAGRERATG